MKENIVMFDEALLAKHYWDPPLQISVPFDVRDLKSPLATEKFVYDCPKGDAVSDSTSRSKSGTIFIK